MRIDVVPILCIVFWSLFSAQSQALRSLLQVMSSVDAALMIWVGRRAEECSAVVDGLQFLQKCLETPSVTSRIYGGEGGL